MAHDVQDPPRPLLRDADEPASWTESVRVWNERYGTYVSFAIVAGLFVAVLLFALGKWREATVRQANRDLLGVQSVDEASKVLERYRGTDAEIAVLLTLADLAMDAGDIERARTSFQRVVDLAGDSPLADAGRRGLAAVKDEEAWKAESPALFEQLRKESDERRAKLYPPKPPELPAGPLPPGIEPAREAPKEDAPGAPPAPENPAPPEGK